jgi:hypothetical protein
LNISLHHSVKWLFYLILTGTKLTLSFFDVN